MGEPDRKCRKTTVSLPSGLPSRLASGLLLVAIAVPVRSESLVELYDLARLHDPRILAVETDRDAASLSPAIARAARRPNLSLFADQVHENDTRLETDDTENRTEAGVSLTVPIYHRGNNLDVRIATLEVAEAEVDVRQAEQELLFRTAQVYFEAAKAGEQVELARISRESLEKQLDLAEQLVQEQLVAQSDALEAQASLDTAIANEVDAQNQLLAANEQLRILSGRYPADIARLPEELLLEMPQPDDVDAWVELALANNPALALAQQRWETLGQQVERARSDSYPTLDFQATYTHTFSDVDTEDDEVLGELRLRFRLPLYQGGGVKARVAQRRLQQDRQQQDVDLLQSELEARARSTFAGIRAAIRKIEALSQAVLSGEKSLEGIRTGVVVQTRSLVDLLDAISRNATLRFELATARYDYLLNHLFLRALAGDLDRESLQELDARLDFVE